MSSVKRLSTSSGGGSGIAASNNSSVIPPVKSSETTASATSDSEKIALDGEARLFPVSEEQFTSATISSTFASCVHANPALTNSNEPAPERCMNELVSASSPIQTYSVMTTHTDDRHSLEVIVAAIQDLAPHKRTAAQIRALSEAKIGLARLITTPAEIAESFGEDLTTGPTSTIGVVATLKSGSDSKSKDEGDARKAVSEISEQPTQILPHLKSREESMKNAFAKTNRSPSIPPNVPQISVPDVHHAPVSIFKDVSEAAQALGRFDTSVKDEADFAKRSIEVKGILVIPPHQRTVQQIQILKLASKNQQESVAPLHIEQQAAKLCDAEFTNCSTSDKKPEGDLMISTSGYDACKVASDPKKSPIPAGWKSGIEKSIWSPGNSKLSATRTAGEFPRLRSSEAELPLVLPQSTSNYGKTMCDSSLPDHSGLSAAAELAGGNSVGPAHGLLPKPILSGVKIASPSSTSEANIQKSSGNNILSQSQQFMPVSTQSQPHRSRSRFCRQSDDSSLSSLPKRAARKPERPKIYQHPELGSVESTTDQNVHKVSGVTKKPGEEKGKGRGKREKTKHFLTQKNNGSISCDKASINDCGSDDSERQQEQGYDVSPDIRGQIGNDSNLQNWDGTWLPPPVDWDGDEDRSFVNGFTEKFVHHWTNSLPKPDVSVDIRSTEFRTGVPLSRELFIPAEMPGHTFPDMRNSENETARHTMTPHLFMLQNTKRQKRDKKLMIALQQSDSRLVLNASQTIDANPNTPAIDCFLRPSILTDVPRMMKIYNEYILNSFVPEDQDTLTEDEMRRWFQDKQSKNLPIIVAVKGLSPKYTREENDEVIGFTFLDGNCGLKSYCTLGGRSRFSGTVFLYVDLKFNRKGVGRCLLDRLLQITASHHSAKDGYEWYNPGNDQSYDMSGNLFHQLRIERPFEEALVGDSDLAWFTDWLHHKFGFKQVAKYEAGGRTKLRGAAAARFLDVHVYQLYSSHSQAFEAFA